MIDIYYENEYGRVFEKTDEGKLEVIEFECEFGEIRYMYLKREIFSDKYRGYYDIVTPYGYGGPIIINCLAKVKLIESFKKYMNKIFEEQNIVSEVIRYHPIDKNYLDFDSYCMSDFIRNTVCVDLTKEDILYTEINKKTRNQIRKAYKENLEIEFDFEFKTLDLFKKMYYQTMDKNNASEYYYFSDEFFTNNTKFLKDKIIIINAYKDNIHLSASMFLISNNYMHYYLSATRNDCYKYCPVDFIIYNAILWGNNNKKNLLNLGGGFSNSLDDSLYKFKRNFSKEGTYEFRLGKSIRNKKIYDALVTEKGLTNRDSDYFPRYRIRK